MNAPATVDFLLIETMAYDPQTGVPLIELHLERMKDSAAQLGFACDRHAIRNEVQAVCFTHREPARLKIELARDGVSAIHLSPLPAPLAEPAPVAIRPLCVEPDDFRLRHKTSARDFYESALRSACDAGAEEAVLQRADGLLTEGCFTNIFVERDGRLLTPPLALGLLPGVLRRSLIEQGRAREETLTAGDLEKGFFIGNSLRGLIRARLLDEPA